MKKLFSWLFPSKGCRHEWVVTGAISETGKYGTWWRDKYTCSRCGTTGEGPLVASLEG